jgi:glutathione-regulated potassium-efflux system ancillary protein KefG
MNGFWLLDGPGRAVWMRDPSYDMGRLIDVDRLIDTRDVARILGLSNRRDVATYLRRYKDMPRPVIDLGRGRAKLWLRPEVDRWQARRKRRGAVGR